MEASCWNSWGRLDLHACYSRSHSEVGGGYLGVLPDAALLVPWATIVLGEGGRHFLTQ